MFWVPDEDHPPFGRIEVDPYLCIGCQKCTSKGPDGAFLDGCPWDAIEMVPTDDWEAVHGSYFRMRHPHHRLNHRAISVFCYRFNCFAGELDACSVECSLRGSVC